EGTKGSEKVADVCAAKPSDLRFSDADFQVVDKLRQFAAAMTGALLSQMAGRNIKVPDLIDQGFDGYPVQRIDYSDGQPTKRAELKSIERATFSDADFSVGSAKKADLIPGRGRQ